jgi:hypothetical protein
MNFGINYTLILSHTSFKTFLRMVRETRTMARPIVCLTLKFQNPEALVHFK